MPFLESVLISAAVVVVAVWAALTLHVLAVQRRRTAAQATVARVFELLRPDDVNRQPIAERVGQVRSILQGASRELLMSAAADRETPQPVFAVLIDHLSNSWGLDALLSDASAHRSAREKWRRSAALRILFRANHPDVVPLLVSAGQEADPDVALAAFALLGQSTDARALDALFDALRLHQHPASRIAACIEQSPRLRAEQLLGLLHEADPVLRLWGATLLARFPDATVEPELAALTADPDPRVRKAAIQTLGVIGGPLAADSAQWLLGDEFPYVRAHAARALGALGRSDLAERITPLLGDRDWWVRLAARESLEMMGPDVWTVLVRCLRDEDEFVRNGAAEVIQNLGVLDSLLVMEAASDSPSESKIAMLRRIASAGGARFTESLVERAGPLIGPRIRHLLTAVGLEYVEVGS